MSDCPRIYVACLAAYNNGILHGEWLDLDGGEELWPRIAAMLAQSPIPGAEEWAVHDHEYCGPLGEYPGLDHLKRIEEAFQECSRREIDWEIFLLYCDCTGEDIDPAQCDRFEETFAGCHDSARAWAESYLEDTGALDNAPVELVRYFNFEAFARDMEIESIHTIPHQGDIYVFWHS